MEDFIFLTDPTNNTRIAIKYRKISAIIEKPESKNGGKTLITLEGSENDYFLVKESLDDVLKVIHDTKFKDKVDHEIR